MDQGRQAGRQDDSLELGCPQGPVPGERSAAPSDPMAYNLGNLWRRLLVPQRLGHWSLTSLQ